MITNSFYEPEAYASPACRVVSLRSSRLCLVSYGDSGHAGADGDYESGEEDL